MTQRFNNIKTVHGQLNLPGDKSLSHRSIMFASLAEGKSIIHNCLNAADIESTIGCFRNLGCSITREGDKVRVVGKGFKGFVKPDCELYAGNSGTTARLISGILATQDFESTIIGDESLSKRPMKRIVEPLRLLGADIEASADGCLPLHFKPTKNLSPIEYNLPVASAQLKSAILLAGLHLEQETCVIEKDVTRNHTEKLLGLKVIEEEGVRKIYSSKKNYPKPFEFFVPADISSAAFFVVLGLLLKDSKLIIKNVLLNETRNGFLRVLQSMGADIQIENQQKDMGELFGDLIVKSSQLKNIVISKELVPNIIDEIPILSVAGIFADGEFEIGHAKELRFKESDRIKAVCGNMKKLGLDVDEFEDGFKISGKPINSFTAFDSYGDHRIAMAFGILSSVLKSGGEIENFNCVKISNPNFIEQLQSIITD